MSSSTVINTNARALNAHRNLNAVGNKQDKATKRLSSGKKINSAADDAAGLAISNKMKAQIRGLDMAYKNSQDAVSLIQTTEGSLSEIDSMVQRMRELTVQASSDTNTGGTQSDRSKIADEVDQLLEEITNMAGRTEFNTKVIATGDYEIGAQVTDGTGNAIAAWKGPKSYDVESVAADAGTSGALVGGKAISFDEGTSFYVKDKAGTVTKAEAAGIKAGADGTTTTVLTADDVKKDENGYLYFESKSAGGNAERKYIKKDMSVAAAEADDVKGSADYVKDNSTLTFQIGANNKSNDSTNTRQSITLNVGSVTADVLFGGSKISNDGTGTIKNTTAKEMTSDIIRNASSSADDIAAVIDTIDSGLDYVTAQRSKLGAVQNRLEYTANNLQVSSENLSTANSRIEDADMAKEMTNLTSANVIQQAAISMLSQANQSQQSVLSLLQ